MFSDHYLNLAIWSHAFISAFVSTLVGLLRFLVSSDDEQLCLKKQCRRKVLSKLRTLLTLCNWVRSWYLHCNRMSVKLSPGHRAPFNHICPSPTVAPSFTEQEGDDHSDGVLCYGPSRLDCFTAREIAAKTASEQGLNLLGGCQSMSWTGISIG